MSGKNNSYLYTQNLMKKLFFVRKIVSPPKKTSQIPVLLSLVLNGIKTPK